MFNISKIIVTLFGVGYFPLAPGTVGSFFSIIFFFLIINHISFLFTISFFFIVFLLSAKLISIYSNKVKRNDSKEIIIDEFLGINLIIIFYDYLKFTNDYFMFLLIFILFRFFDIIKIFPANYIDKNIKNSYGVIFDDLVAGSYCIVILFIINVFF